ncbi:MAG: RDD family protein [Methyloligellaceae bacterium]
MEWYCAFDGRLRGPHARGYVEGLLRSGLIDRETKVWREGMPRWVALGSVDDFKALLASVPPPVPPEPGLAQGGPWSRYFARQFDLTVLAFIIVFAIEIYLPELSMDAFLLYAKANQSVTGLGIVASAFALNALVLTVFGNSPGKALFGLQAVPYDGTGGFGLAGNVAREFRVWFFGFGIGIPIVALFTMLRNYREVGAGRPAAYDRRFAKIEVKPISPARRAVSMISVAGLLAGAIAFVVWGKRYEEQIASPKTWSNSISGLSTTIPGGWTTKTTTSEDGTEFYVFSTSDHSKVVYLAAEDDTNDGTDLNQYAQAIDRSVADWATLSGSWRPEKVDGTPMLRKEGREIEKGRSITILLAKFGKRFWRIVVMKRDSADRSDPAKMPLVTALNRTLT